MKMLRIIPTKTESFNKFIFVLDVIVLLSITTSIFVFIKLKKKTGFDMKKLLDNKVKDINKSIEKNADVMKASVEKTLMEISDSFSDAHNKTEAVKKDIKDGYKKITKNIKKNS